MAVRGGPPPYRLASGRPRFGRGSRANRARLVRKPPSCAEDSPLARRSTAEPSRRHPEARRRAPNIRIRPACSYPERSDGAAWIDPESVDRRTQKRPALRLPARSLLATFGPPPVLKGAESADQKDPLPPSVQLARAPSARFEGTSRSA